MKEMENPKFKSLQKFYLSSTSELCGIVLATQGKSIHDLTILDLYKIVGRQNVLKGIFTKKLNQLLKERR